MAPFPGSRGSQFPHFFDPVPKGVFLKVPWLILAPFLLDFGSFWLPFGTLLAPFVVSDSFWRQIWLFSDTLTSASHLPFAARGGTLP